MFNKVNFKKDAFYKDSSQSDLSKTCSLPTISISTMATPKNRNRPCRKAKKVQKPCEPPKPKPKVETTLDKPVDYSLSIELENKNISIVAENNGKFIVENFLHN